MYIYIICDLSTCEDPSQDAMRLKGLAPRDCAICHEICSSDSASMLVQINNIGQQKAATMIVFLRGRHTCIYICIYMYTYVYIYIYNCICVRVYINTCTYIYIYASM